MEFCQSEKVGTLNAFLLPPATKLGQGYVFTHVCDSVHGGGAQSLSRCPGGGSVRGISVLGGLCPGGLCLEGDLCPGGVCHVCPPYGNERAVPILLECILVLIIDYAMIYK